MGHWSQEFNDTAKKKTTVPRIHLELRSDSNTQANQDNIRYSCWSGLTMHQEYEIDSHDHNSLNHGPLERSRVIVGTKRR